MTAMARLYERMGMAELRPLARQDSEDYDDEATRVYVQRLIDMELERRLDLVHRRPGWHPASPGFGDGTGASTVAHDAMFLAYVHGIHSSQWHDYARRACAQLNDRKLCALLIQAAKADHRLVGPFAATHDQIAASLGHYLQLLGWPPGAKALAWFAKGQAIKRASTSGRAELLLLAKAGAV